MARVKSALLFVLQSITVGLAVAFLVVLVRPDLLPVISAGNVAPASYADAVAMSAPAVANVYTKRLVEAPSLPEERTRFRVETSFGSAVVIDPEGFLVTNYHVVNQAAEIRVQLADGRVAVPELVGVDAESDLALLKVDAGPLPAIRLGRSSLLRIGDVVLAIGNPYGFSKSVTLGVVSGIGRYLPPPNLTTFGDYIQTDAAINSGNSGGALVNTAGELVGINAAILAQDATTEGISFAIPVDLVRGVTDQIRQHGRVIRGWMGLEPDDLTRAEREANGLENDVGILVSDIYEGGPADVADLRVGDIIIEIDGERIYSRRQALLLVTAAKPGDRIELVGLRDAVEFRKTIIAAERPGAPD